LEIKKHAIFVGAIIFRMYKTGTAFTKQGNHKQDIKISKYLFLILIWPFLLSATIILKTMPSKNLPTVDKVDINRYLGKWYEIARLPNSFEKGLKCTSATYSTGKNGKINVLNQGRKTSAPEKQSTINGYARIPDPAFPGRLKVTFFWPFAGDYYIIDLDHDYHYVLVGDPSRKYLWILCRDKKISPDIFARLLSKASTLGFDTSKIIQVEHDCQ
jgi:apolipoprotein D and lipocalin family protein